MAELDACQLDAMLRNPWFAALGDALRADILARAGLRRLRKGEALYRQRSPGSAWYGVVSGAIKVSNTTADGREATLTYLEPGAWFGEISIFDGQPRTHDGHAQGDTEVLVLARADFEAVYDAHREFARALLALQCARLRLLFGAVEDASMLPLDARLARRLLSLADVHGRLEPDRSVLIDLHLPQDALAQLVGANRQRVNETLKGWEREGWLRLRYGRVVLCRREALARIAGTPAG